MKICIDNRERPRIPKFSDYIKSGKTKFIDGIVLGNYISGDFHTQDHLVGIEFKHEDFVESMFDGRLDKQLKELVDNFERPYLFIGYEGITDMISSNLGVNPDSLVGELASVLGRHNVTVMFVGDLLVMFTCKVIERHYDGKTPIKDAEYTPIRKSFLKREPSIIEIRHAMLGQIPNLGALKTNHIIEHFGGSINRVCNATVEELMEVEGVGKKLAERIRKVLE